MLMLLNRIKIIIISDGAKGLNVVLLLFRRTLSVATGPVHQDLLLPGDDHVESRFRSRPCFKTEERSTIGTLPRLAVRDEAGGQSSFSLNSTPLLKRAKRGEKHQSCL